MTHPAHLRESALGRQVAVVGNFTLDAARALRDLAIARASDLFRGGVATAREAIASRA